MDGGFRFDQLPQEFVYNVLFQLDWKQCHVFACTSKQWNQIVKKIDQKPVWKTTFTTEAYSAYILDKLFYELEMPQVPDVCLYYCSWRGSWRENEDFIHNLQAKLPKTLIIGVPAIGIIGSKTRQDGVLECEEVEANQEGFSISLIHLPQKVRCNYFTTFENLVQADIPKQNSHVMAFGEYYGMHRMDISNLKQYACTGGLADGDIVIVPPGQQFITQHPSSVFLVFYGEGLLSKGCLADGYLPDTETYQICQTRKLPLRTTRNRKEEEVFGIESVQQVRANDEEGNNMVDVGSIMHAGHLCSMYSALAVRRTQNNPQQLLTDVPSYIVYEGQRLPYAKSQISNGDILVPMQNNQKSNRQQVESCFKLLQKFYVDQNIQYQQQFGEQNRSNLAWGVLSQICAGRGQNLYNESNVESSIFQSVFQNELLGQNQFPGLVGFFANGEIGPQPIGKEGCADPRQWQIWGNTSVFTLLGFKQ
eukprot:TRINITY_DN40334_c0_g2_i2.p1 TRINITY_DN40334_c0_g2~~TRINITY_DN40334_c0_g2_i2.p1  ORF type:complete len:477 (-),score=46.56 TRINITY_DN40334_c0_g2_i2:329-1759(-)